MLVQRAQLSLREDTACLFCPSASLVLILDYGFAFLAAGYHFPVCRLLFHILQLYFFNELAVLLVQRAHVSLRADAACVAAKDEAEKTHATDAFLEANMSFVTRKQLIIFIVNESTVLRPSLIHDFSGLHRLLFILLVFLRLFDLVFLEVLVG